VLDDIFELQDEIAASVAGAIEPKLRQSEIERARRKPTERLDAYDLYLRALAGVHSLTESGLDEALVFLCRALSIDPSYAPAAAMIGWCRAVQRMQAWGAVSEEEVTETIQLVRHALEKGRDDPDTVFWAANALFFFAGDTSVAIAALERALSLNPNAALAWQARGWIPCLL